MDVAIGGWPGPMAAPILKLVWGVNDCKEGARLGRGRDKQQMFGRTPCRISASWPQDVVGRIHWSPSVGASEEELRWKGSYIQPLPAVKPY
jgi:hypothetical protein